MLLRLTPKTLAFKANVRATSDSLSLDMTTAAADLGRFGNVYVAALAGSNWYAFNGSSSVPWSGGDFPSARQVNLPPDYSVTVLSWVDLRPLAGVQLVAGYGESVQVMG